MDQKMCEAMAALESQRQKHGLVLDRKLYSKVADRVEIFRSYFGTDYGLDTTIDYRAGFNLGAPVIAIAKITKGEQIIASGYAIEFVGTSDFTKYSPIEVAETSAIGRALAAFGLSGGEYASANEIEAHARARDRANGNVERVDIYPSQEKLIHSNGADEPDEAAPDETSDEEGSGLYIPQPDDPLWDKPADIHSVILDGLERIDDHDRLSIYWAELKPTMERMNAELPKMYGQIKAAFAAAYSTIEGRQS